MTDAPLDLDVIRDLIARRGPVISTHWHGCYRDHVECAAQKLLAEVDRLHERIVTVDLDGREVTFDKVAECEAALSAVEEDNDRWRERHEQLEAAAYQLWSTTGGKHHTSYREGECSYCSMPEQCPHVAVGALLGKVDRLHAEREPGSHDVPDRSLAAVTRTWQIVEDTLREVGMTGPPGDPMFASRAEEVSKAILARMAVSNPPIIPCFSTELDELERLLIQTGADRLGDRTP